MKLNRLLMTVGTISATLMGSAFYSAPSFAQASSSDTNSSMIYAGALLGVGFFNNNGGTQIGFGFDGGYKLTSDWGAGLYLTYQPTQAPTGSSAGVYTAALEGNYFLDKVAPGLRVGAKAGLGIASFSTDAIGAIPSTSTTNTDIVFGPHVAYDYALGQGLSVGGETNFLFFTSSPARNVFNLLGSVKYWF